MNATMRRQALRRRIESHVRVQQQRVSRRGSLEDAVHVRGVAEAARIADDQRAGDDAAPRLDALGGAVVDEDQSHRQAVGGSARDAEQRPDQFPLVGVDDAHVQVELVFRRAGVHGSLPGSSRFAALLDGGENDDVAVLFEGLAYRRIGRRRLAGARFTQRTTASLSKANS